MKKALSLMLIALIAVTSVFATGTTETTATAAPAEGGKIYDGVELTMWSMWNAAEIQGQIIQEAAAAVPRTRHLDDHQHCPPGWREHRHLRGRLHQDRSAVRSLLL